MGYRWLAKLFAALAILSACAVSAPAAPTPAPLAGRYLVSGGGTAIPAVKALTEAFSKRHPGVVWVIEDVGSDTGVKLVAAGSVDLGMISRDLKESERGQVEALRIGMSGTAVAVNAANTVRDLKKDQVRGIFAGLITDWAAVGGKAARIKVLVREADSTTRVTFEQFFFGGKPAYTKEAIEVYEGGGMVDSLRSFTDAIGMVAANEKNRSDQTLRLLAVDGVAPSRENLLSGAYKIGRPLHLVHHPEKLKPAIRALLDFVGSDEGQKIIASQ